MGTLLMTGASRGLGREAAERLLRDHPDQHLLLTVRGANGDRLAAELAGKTGNANVSTVPADLASFASLHEAVREIERRIDAGELPPLTGFLGNAGLQLTSTERATEDGFEVTFGVNVLAYYLLLRLLFDRFQPGSRIVVVGSDVHFGDVRHNLGLVPAPRWATVAELARPRPGGALAGRRAYATSKLGVLYLVHALARRLPDGVDAYTYNPGLVPGTGLLRDAHPVTRAVAGPLLQAVRATPFAMGPVAAGGLLAETALGPRPGASGSYLDRGKVAPSSPESYDEDREEELWAAAAQLCGLPVEVR
ncbi:SDR family NAD(P)-dependent oxidoreductase [Prauserella flavalba]|uniref:Short-chain dehydrogenase n=1 Tax=Prauserella flavalba TaxID=1477506 RepID=A0A318LKL3_9PSEU|nr:SDR family NAD(P)-dependent oxidoreductase [Prauserella flavalba]PXY33997.1 short-chain dehydrogenase [Prauserella flavalba]